MTKADFVNQFDFDTLSRATEIEVRFTDKTVKRYGVLNYWDTTPMLVDAIECLDPSVPDDAPENDRLPILYVPDPAIASIQALATIDHPNHGGHPEIGIVFPTIDELYTRQGA